MSDCSEIGHNYTIGLREGIAVYGCNRGCGDIIPLFAMEKKEIVEVVTDYLKKEKEEYDIFL